MDAFYDMTLFWLFVFAIPIGIFAIVFGGTMFLSMPVFQIFFPELSLGAIIGNIKVGSVIRNAGAIWILRKNIELHGYLGLLFFFCVGSILGAFFISSASQAFVLPVIVFAIFVTEFSSALAKVISGWVYYLVAFLVGFFGGMIGAGVSLLIIALLRIKRPHDHSIQHVRSMAIFVEFIMAVTSVAVFCFTGQLIFHIWLVWAAGSLFGGYLGGIIIRRTGKMKPAVQKSALRLVFVFAVVVALIKLL